MIKLKKNLFIVGLPGSGKSSVLKILSEDFGYTVIDVDELVELEAGMKPEEVVRNNGLEALKKIERRILRRLKNVEGYIIATIGLSQDIPDSSDVVYLKHPRSKSISKMTIKFQFKNEKRKKRLLALYDEFYSHFSKNSSLVISVEGKNRFEIAKIIDDFIRKRN